MPETVLANAAQAGERLRAAISDMEVWTGSDKLRVTVSVGVAQWKTGDGFDELLRRADAALYAAKHGGRNRVCSDTVVAP